jgi:hypothetical protein
LAAKAAITQAFAQKIPGIAIFMRRAAFVSSVAAQSQHFRHPVYNIPGRPRRRCILAIAAEGLAFASGDHCPGVLKPKTTSEIMPGTHQDSSGQAFTRRAQTAV